MVRAAYGIKNLKNKTTGMQNEFNNSKIIQSSDGKLVFGALLLISPESHSTAGFLISDNRLSLPFICMADMFQTDTTTGRLSSRGRTKTTSLVDRPPETQAFTRNLMQSVFQACYVRCDCEIH